MKRRDPEELQMEQLDDELAEGRITREQYNAEARAIRRWYRDEQLARAEDAARDAYNRELER